MHNSSLIASMGYPYRVAFILDKNTHNHMRVLSMLKSSLSCMAGFLTILLQTCWHVEEDWYLVREAWGSLLGKVGYRTPEACSGGISRRAGCRAREAASIAC